MPAETKLNCPKYLRREVELVKRDEVTFEEADKKAEEDAVGELAVEVGHLQVQLVQVLVDKRHQRLLHHLSRI